MNSTEKFQNDLKIGQSNEELIANYFINKGYKVEFNKSNNYEELCKWDLKINGKLVEVKQDHKSQYTNNVCIEKRCVEKTTSNIWIYNLGTHGTWISKLDNIKHKLTSDVEGFWVHGGDGKRSYMKVIRIEEFLKGFKKLN